MDPVRFSVERPYTVAVAVLLALLFSVLAYLRIPVQLKPTVDNPIIVVETIYRGAGPVEVEERITREVEDLLQSVDGLDRLTSRSVEGQSTVTLEYTWGVDKDRAVVDVINKLSELPDLPEDAEAPVVSLTNQQGGNAVMWIASRGAYPPDRVRQIIKDQVEARLERVPGVASLMVVGGEEREIRVTIDPELLAARGVGWAELESALRSGAVDLRGGTVETPTRQYVVRTEGRTNDPQDLLGITIRRDARGTVRVGDVATVIDGHREQTSVVRNEFGDMVAIGVRSEPGSNVVTLIEGVDEEILALNERFHEQGLDLSLVPVYRDTTYLGKAMDFVIDSLWQGALLAVVVLLVFLRSVRSMLIVALSIPISLLTVFLVMDLFGRTLNVVSLAGLAFAAGMVVDNAIVVLENTFRHLEMGKGARQAAIDGGKEVWGGVLASTLTTMAVFIPILGIQEEAGQLFADLALAIAAAVGLSLVVALTVIPCLAALFYRRRGEARGSGVPASAAAGATSGASPALKEVRPEGRFTRWYGRSVGALAGAGPGRTMGRVLLVAVVVAVSLAALWLVPPAGYLPSGNANLIFYFGDPIPGMRPEAQAENLAPLEAWVKAQPETERFFLVIASGFNGGGVILKDEYATATGLDAYQQRMVPVAVSAPGYRSMFPVRSSLFRDSGSQFTIEITGPDLERLAETAGKLQAQLMSFPALNRVSSDYVQGRPEIKVFADPHLASEAGLSVQQVGLIVETALAGRTVGSYSDGARDYDVIVVAPQERVTSPEDLASLPVVTPRGARTTLGALARVEISSGPQSVQRIERERAITLTVDLRPGEALQSALDEVASRAVAPALAGLPRGYRIELGGSADKFSSTLSALTGSFWLALLITYLLLVALFQSWLSPLVIMITIPLSLTGGLFGVTLAHTFSPNASFDLLAMLGFVILAGIVVNNAILIVHQSNNLRAAGTERRAALAEASRSRLRPIAMTVCTTVFGMLPLTFGSATGAELYQGLAAVVVGGLVLSTLFTLFLVPALVALGWDLGDRFGARPQREALSTASPGSA
ncbi:MAG: efflux RND transporter permease subunit [Planctomycetota bacterium]